MLGPAADRRKNAKRNEARRGAQGGGASPNTPKESLPKKDHRKDAAGAVQVGRLESYVGTLSSRNRPGTQRRLLPGSCSTLPTVSRAHLVIHHRLAPAKVNLGLHVLRRRADGFHEIETVLLPIGWADALTAEAADTLALTCSDPDLPEGPGNLVWQAAEALAEVARVGQGASIHLDKRVPYGAGLGSGSSDAAATLRLLGDLWQTALPEDEIHRLAADLGSDVPFFLLGGPAHATGRGEVLAPLTATGPPDGEPYRCPFELVVAVPPVPVNTGTAYGWVTPRDTGRPDLAAAVRSNDLDRWQRELVNDFEAPVAERFPEVQAALEALRRGGAGYAALSGSGSAVVGAFERKGAAETSAEVLREAGCRVWTELAGA